MKKTCSIFVIALILYISAINIRPVYADTLSETLNKNLNVNLVENFLIENIQCTLENIQETDNVLEVFKHDNQQLYITGEDIELMAKLVSAESIGEPYDGKVAVASVVLNRTLDPSFPNTIKDVIFQKNAFSCVRNGQINANANQDCYNAVYDAIKGHDPTNQALFFYNPSTATCNWMKQTPKFNKTTIGHHTFFKIKN
ncbi:cell wall hydrolase [uncultured Clostridium sp.]|uniref:cell wall hydrolase n=1 Tax=uncultured Clostridium sp. TaxID=59620 RepID=UPI0025CD5B04|nr:cell wall hydrolase [uncultured Clostridium sp.]